MNISINSGKLYVQTITDINIDKCIQCRNNNRNSYFGKTGDYESSKNWIINHMFNDDNCLLQIVYDDIFVGTIGYTLYDNYAEVGRLGLYTPGIKEIIKKNKHNSDIKNIGQKSCLLLINYIFDKYANILYTYGEVIVNNGFSNAMCLSFAKGPELIEKNIDGEIVKINRYIVDRDNNDEKE